MEPIGSSAKICAIERVSLLHDGVLAGKTAIYQCVFLVCSRSSGTPTTYDYLDNQNSIPLTRYLFHKLPVKLCEFYRT